MFNFSCSLAFRWGQTSTSIGISVLRKLAAGLPSIDSTLGGDGVLERLGSVTWWEWRTAQETERILPIP
jgi:hypothetical protein